MSCLIVCVRSANILSFLSLVAFLVGAIMINIKLSLVSAIPWVEALAPFNVLVFSWFLIMLYITFCFIFQFYRLKVLFSILFIVVCLSCAY